MHNEAEQLLGLIGWKRHRGEISQITARQINRDNLAYELADISKYALSLWQVWGFSAEEALREIAQKGEIMEFRLQQEYFPSPPKGARVLVVDLDGTLADLRVALWDFAINKSWTEARYVVSSLNPDVDLTMDYRSFQKMKEQFILARGYENLLPFGDAAALVRRAINDGVYTIVCTARPVDKYPHLWIETRNWLKRNNLPVKQLHIGGEVRINLILDLAEDGYDVVLMDDDPDLVERALNSNIKVVLPQYPYNAAHWRHTNVTPLAAILSGNRRLPFRDPEGEGPHGDAIPARGGGGA